MKNELINFEFEEKQVRIIKFEGKFYFIASDISKSLNYAQTSDCLKLCKTKYIKRFEYKTLVECNYSDTANSHIRMFNNRGAIGILEPGLWEILSKTKSKKAESFQDELFEKILPQIRKTGKYELEKFDNNEKQISVEKEAVELLKIRLEIAKIYKCPDSFAYSEATKDVHKKLGVDLTSYLLKSPTQYNIEEKDIYLEPTELGKMVGISGRKANEFITTI